MRVVIAVLLIILTAGAQAGSQAPSKSVFQTEQNNIFFQKFKSLFKKPLKV